MRSGKNKIENWPGWRRKSNSCETELWWMVGPSDADGWTRPLHLSSPNCFRSLDSNSRPGMECRLFGNITVSGMKEEKTQAFFRLRRLFHVNLLQWFSESRASCGETCRVWFGIFAALKWQNWRKWLSRYCRFPIQLGCGRYYYTELVISNMPYAQTVRGNSWQSFLEVFTLGLDYDDDDVVWGLSENATWCTVVESHITVGGIHGWSLKALDTLLKIIAT